MEDGSSEALVARAREGDRTAAGELVRRFEERIRIRLHGRLAARLRGRVGTEDLVQSTILAALDGLPRFTWRGEEAFVGWLSAVAERQILMTARHHRAARRDAGRDRPGELAGEVGTERTTPPEGAARREVTKRLRATVESLPEPQRRVVELHSFLGLGFEAVSRHMGLSGKGAAYRLFEKALQRLGEALDTDDGEGDDSA